MPEQSAGLLVFRRSGPGVEFLLAHPGGPFWAGRDEGAWSIPKGLVGEGEEVLAAARREFEEETGQTVEGDFQPLEPLRQPSGKIVHAWLVEAELDMESFRSSPFEIEWPRRSGRTQTASRKSISWLVRAGGGVGQDPARPGRLRSRGYR